MSRSKRGRLVAGCLGSCAALLAAVDAHAATNCSSLSGTIIYGAGGSAQQPYLTALGTQLAKLSSPVHIVYSDSGSACVGYGDLVTPTAITGTALYWDGSGATLTCTLDAGGDPTTFAVMGNSPKLCTSVVTPDSGTAFGQFLGPVQAVDFIVPHDSTQQSISTEAAYYIWGFDASDAAHTVAPWSTPANIFTRSASSYVNLFVALDTGVPAATVAARGTLEGTGGATLTAVNGLNGTSGAQSGIAFASNELADGNPSQIKVLAYQHTGQSCGYTPDSTTGAFDKINVRDGQYWLWSPVHLFAAVGSNNAITDAATANLVGWITGTVAPPTGLDPFSAAIAAYTVPECAMDVWRDDDLAPLYSKEQPASCACKYDFATSTSSQLRPSSCTTCTQDSDCAVTHHCRNIGPPLNSDAGGSSVGYCEVN